MTGLCPEVMATMPDWSLLASYFPKLGGMRMLLLQEVVDQTVRVRSLVMRRRMRPSWE
jgi:hypothetical protein